MSRLLTDKKGGVVSNTVMGVGALIIAVIVILVITSTLLTSDLFTEADITTEYTNETTTNVNETGVTFGNSTLPSASCVADIVTNSTGGETISSGNYTVTASTCKIVFASGDAGYNNTAWNISSTTTYEGDEETASKNIQYNFTDGIDNISKKIPTILLIVAVVFLFGALVLLIRQAKLMGIGGGGSL